MAITRSASRTSGTPLNNDVVVAEAPAPTRRKRRAETVSEPPKPKRSKSSAIAKSAAPAASPAPKPTAPRRAITVDPDATVIPAELSFSFAEAKAHLIQADARFAEVFGALKCKPFEEPEPMDPFRTLAMSILGQQISWLAARSIKHKFIRLFDPSLPEKAPPVGEKDHEFFPTAAQVSGKDIPTLRTAGLSQRKAEYILDLASHFQDGRLSAAKLAQWEDDEVYENLIAVRGIGKWSVDMFAMFSLRRPDILAVGDLGLQKGLLRWVLSSHQGTKVSISSKKLAKQPAKEDEKEPNADASALPPVPDPEAQVQTEASSLERKTPERDVNGTTSLVGQLPTPLTPGQSLPSGVAAPESPSKVSSGSSIAIKPVELPDGLTVAALKSRYDGKKVKKGQYLSPEEMEALTASWAPYRSLGCYYLWALGED